MDSVGVVVVGPAQPPFGGLDRTRTFAFNQDGDPLGQSSGGAIGDAQALTSPERLITVSADGVAALEQGEKEQFLINGSIVQASAQNLETGRAAMWFNTGFSEGGYKNTYVSIDRENNADTGSVPGLVLATAFCGDSLFAVVEDVTTAKFGQSYTSWLYEVPPGGEPVVRGEIEFREAFQPAAREAACSPDGTTIYSLYASSETRASKNTDEAPGLSLVRINTSDGSKEESEIAMHGQTWRIAWGTVSGVDDRLFWSTADGQILSVSTVEPHAAKSEWRLPAGGLSTRTSVAGTTVTQIDFRDVPTYSEYDLRLGERTLGPIELPWLHSFVDADTESGKSIYTLTDVGSLGTRN